MKVEIRNDSVHIEGYVNVALRDSRILPSPRGQFVEQVKPLVFQRALEKTDNVDVLFNHMHDRKLGSTKEGNVKLWEDNIGLRAMMDTNDPEVMQKAMNKELRGWSFGFIMNKDKWETGSDGMQRRFLEDITLSEVSVLSVTPAYIATSIEARGEESVIIEQRNIIEETVDYQEDLKDVDKDKQEEEKRAKEETLNNDYLNCEAEINLLRLKQPRH